jgi:putative chitinase
MVALLVILALGAVTYAQEQTHTVASGENLYRISLKYNVSLTALAAANSISNPNLIFAGQVLKIPGTTGGTTPPPATQPPAGTPPPATGGTYVVQRGDTLGRIAAKFGTTFQAIASANNLSNPNLIFAGQTLNIPGGGTTPPPATQPPGPAAARHPRPPTRTRLPALNWAGRRLPSVTAT